MATWGKSLVRQEKDKWNNRKKLGERVLAHKIKKDGTQMELQWATQTT